MTDLVWLVVGYGPCPGHRAGDLHQWGRALEAERWRPGGASHLRRPFLRDKVREPDRLTFIHEYART